MSRLCILIHIQLLPGLCPPLNVPNGRVYYYQYNAAEDTGNYDISPDTDGKYALKIGAVYRCEARHMRLTNYNTYCTKTGEWSATSRQFICFCMYKKKIIIMLTAHYSLFTIFQILRSAIDS